MDLLESSKEETSNMSDSLSLETLSLESAPTLPPIRYFDFLPPEIILSIFVQVEDQYPIYIRPGKQSLRSLCLTSRHFRSIAQPLLLAEVDLIGSWDNILLKLLEHNSVEALGFVRTILLGGNRLAADSLIPLVHQVPGLQKLVIVDHKEHLRPFLGSNVTHVALRALDLSDLGTVHFPRLECMALLHCYFRGGGGGAEDETKFDLPSLRRLVYLTNKRSIPHVDLQHLHDFASTLTSICTLVATSSSLPASITENTSISQEAIIRVQDRNLNATTFKNVKRIHLTLSESNLREDVRLLGNHWPSLIYQAETLERLDLPHFSEYSGYVEIGKDVYRPVMEVCRQRNIKVKVEPAGYTYKF